MVGLMTLIGDLLLILLLITLAWMSLGTRDLHRAVILFIAFGLLLALTWARLDAPDVALAEAAIGAGLTGALLLAALRDYPSTSQETANRRAQAPTPDGVVLSGLLALALLACVAGLAWAYAQGIGGRPGLTDAVMGSLERSGVSNPVTAVLLNFRALDTLLEIAVLLVAVLGVFALNTERHPYGQPEPVLVAFVRWLVPLLVVAGGYLLWVGAHAPGGAFQAGALLAAAGVVMRLTGHGISDAPRGALGRLFLVAGVAVFLATGIGVMLAGGAFLEYPTEFAGTLILLIEVAATASIAAILISAFNGGRATSRGTALLEPAVPTRPGSRGSARSRESSRC